MMRCGVALLMTLLSSLAVADDSALLAGLVPPAPGADYPAQLVLPAGWLAPLNQLAADSLNRSDEVAQCVYLPTPDKAPTALRDAIDKYGNAINLGDKGLHVAARAVTSAMAAAGVSPVLSLGKKQTGEESSVGTICVGTTLGAIHTHPQKLIQGSTELLSDGDTANLVLGGNPMAGVVSGHNMCVALSRQDPPADSAAVIRASFGAEIMMSSTGGPVAGHMPKGLARLIGHYGGALYCGPIGPTLPRIPASTDSDPGNTLLLEAKAWVMAMKLVRQTDWPALDFPFTPSADPAFLRYLRHVLSAPSLQALNQWQLNHGDSAALLRLVAVDAGAASDALWSNGFMMPDPRRPLAAPPYASFMCDAQQCRLEQSHSDSALSDDSGQLVEEYWKGGVLRENTVPVTTSLSSAQQAVLEAKSALLATKWSSHPEWPLVNFDFSPELDEPFWKYLKNVWPQQQMNTLATARASGDALALTRLISKTFMPEPQSWGVLATVPDAGNATFVFTCSDDACSLAPVDKGAYFSGAAMPAARASYSAKGANLLDSKGAQALARISFPDGSVYVGGYQLQDHVLKKSGRGRLKTRSYTLDGIFANDELAGTGKIQMPGSATWHVVTLQNNSLHVDARPASAPGAASQ
jgi:hypothetical protein